ncbi:MAG: mismatch endonuclease Vsr protein [Candidatus Nomurabacteria bacterium GW2011_GWA2_40_9]|uniref:Mismatch endonuclease Vsr protein n=1 Tax=Candidatus Nomurabacteria bacterium GW2011_GWA2_40_9 TaxID=1618734 RepID=A0A0G0WRL3_9BACT|nr:MAG: mismatch endonuclease Vsr protein [Candidatus Nomurabacteria bacterium GW2011_GWA2_40_9]
MAINMPDTFSKKKRSQIMSKVKSKETNLELCFRKLLIGYRFRYQPKVFGKPDFALKKLKIAIFIDSCFWHKCPKHFRKPNSNISYWKPKINRNVERAKEVNKQFKKDGWIVFRFWEHDIKVNPEKCINKVSEKFGRM